MKNYLTNFLLSAFALLLLLYPAIDNGFPLVYSDTGTYIVSGFEGYVPVDRPIMYGLFVRHISLAHSLWFVVLFQATIIFLLILALYKYLIKAEFIFIKSALTIAILSLLTGLPYYVCHIMPDFLTGSGIIVMTLLFFKERLNNVVIFFLVLLFIVINISHLSHLLITTILATFLIIYLIFNKGNFKVKKIVFISAIIVLSWLVLPSINYLHGSNFQISRAKNIFIMGRLAETEILSQYLSHNCKTKHYELCNYKSDLPKQSFRFIWDNPGPLLSGNCMKKGWDNCWLEKDKEYSRIINDIVTTPIYYLPLFKEIVKGTFKQLIDFELGPFDRMMEGSPVLPNIERYLKRDIKEYRSAKQASGNLYFRSREKVQNTVVFISALLLILIFAIKNLRNSISYELIIFTAIVMVGLIVNAFICSTLSTVVNRFQGRVIWLVPLLAILIFVHLSSKSSFALFKNNK